VTDHQTDMTTLEPVCEITLAKPDLKSYMTRKRAQGTHSEAALFMLKGGSLTQCLPGRSELSELSECRISLCQASLRSRSSKLVGRARVLLSDYLLVCCSTSHASFLYNTCSFCSLCSLLPRRCRCTSTSNTLPHNFHTSQNPLCLTTLL